MSKVNVGILPPIWYNISATNAAGQRPVATQKNISYHYLSPSGFLLHWSRFVTGNLGGLYFWGKGMGKRKTIEDYYTLASLRGFNWLGTELPLVTDKTFWQCAKGHIWKAVYHNIVRGHGCPYCVRGHIPKSIEDYHNLAKERGFIWLGIELPLTIKWKTPWQCSRGHQWNTRFNDIQQGHGCPYCAGLIRKSIEDYHALATKRGFTWLGPEVSRNNIKTTWQCQSGHQWLADFDHIQRGTGCPYCAGNYFPKTVEDYYSLAKKRGFIWLGPEVSLVVKKSWWQCKKGHKWEGRFSAIQNGQGCPICRQSKGEESVAKFLDEYSIFHIRGKKFDKCQDKDFLPFDFYFYLDQTHFLVEYDGIQHYESVDYWGGDEALKKCQQRDKIKDEFAKEYGFILIRIPYTIKNIKAYLQFELEKYLSFPIDQLKNQPKRPQPKIKPINPYQWRQGVLL